MPRIVFRLATIQTKSGHRVCDIISQPEGSSWRHISSDNMCIENTMVVVVCLSAGQCWLCSLAVHGPSVALRAGSNPHNYFILLLPFPPREMQGVHEEPNIFSWPCLWQCALSLICHYWVHEGGQMETSLYAEPGAKDKAWLSIAAGLLMTHQHLALSLWLSRPVKRHKKRDNDACGESKIVRFGWFLFIILALTSLETSTFLGHLYLQALTLREGGKKG